MSKSRGKGLHRAGLHRAGSLILAMLMVMMCIASSIPAMAIGVNKGEGKADTETTETEQKPEKEEPVYIEITDMDGKVVTLKVFKDVVNHWARQQVTLWQYYDIIKGTSEANFEPDGNITRRDFAVIINRLLGYQDRAVNTFEDLEDNQYYTDAVLKCNAAGIMLGSNNYVRPHEPITRQEAIVMVCRAFKIEPEGGTLKFNDRGSVSDWAYGYVKAMETYKYVSGTPDNRIVPTGNLTRAEAVTVFNNIIRAYYKDNSNTYTNSYSGNGLLGSKSVNLLDTSVNGNFYVPYLAKGGDIQFNNTDITGSVYVFPNAKITAKESDIRNLVLYSDNSTVTGADNFDYIYVMAGKNTKITGVPGRLVLEPNTSVTIEDLVITNESGSRTVTYSRSTIENEIVTANGEIKGGPKVSLGGVDINSKNEVTLKSIKIDNSGDSDIAQIGLIYNRDNEVPTLDDYDSKSKLSDNLANYEGGMTTQWGTQTDGTTYTYRIYAINDSGKIGYSKPYSVASYSFNIKGNIIGVTTDKDKEGNVSAVNKTFEVLITGSNVPKISKVECLSNQNNGIEEQYTVKNCTLGTSNSAKYNQKYSYTVTLTYKVDTDGNIEVDNYFGYRVTTGDKFVYETFPTFTETSTIESDVNNVKTGNASLSGENSTSNDTMSITVSGNSFSEGTGLITETGVVILTLEPGEHIPTSVKSADGWKKYPNYTGSGELSTYYSVTTQVTRERDKTYCYASYVKTSSRVTYGSIKSIDGPSVPKLTGEPNIKLSDDRKTAVVTLNISSYNNSLRLSESYIKKIRNATDGVDVPGSTTKSIASYSGSYSNGILKFTITDLKPEVIYEVYYNLSNDTGTTSEMVIQIDTHDKNPQPTEPTDKEENSGDISVNS